MEKSYDILAILERANTRKKEGFKVISGCAGMLFNDDKSLCTYPSINSAIKKRFEDYLVYPAIYGSNSYKKGILNWIFKNNLEEIEERFGIPFCATIGGTGACSFAFKYEASINKGVGLLSDIYWPNYRNIAEDASLNLDFYKMFDENNKFNFLDIKKHIDLLLTKYDSVLFILNDPCQNPSGFCLSKEEYLELFNLLSSYNNKVKLFFDVAYMDYAPMGFIFNDILLNTNKKFDITIAFSCSKTFGLYGMRVGAIFDLLNDKSLVQDKQTFYNLEARSTYSCPNNTAVGPLGEVLNDSSKVDKLRKDLKKEALRLESIGNNFVKMLDNLKIKHLPYNGGFYIIMVVDDAYSFCARLEDKDIYFVPITKNYIRVAIASLSLDEIKELKKKIL